MSVVRDDCDERQTRVDLMIDEFHKAQSRRLANATTVKGDDQMAEFAERRRWPGGDRRVNSYTDMTRE
jgi:hypothetical protein